VILTGTTRTDGPPRPIVGPRVATLVQNALERRGNIVTAVLDPLQDDYRLPLLEKPEFAYSRRQVPAHLANMQRLLQEADAYVAITPEYNHAPSPGLLNTLNHFGSSTFSFKPSAIVSYSQGQWGGTRAALALRPILSELGCLPVSAMIHIPKAHEVLAADGTTTTTTTVVNNNNNNNEGEEVVPRTTTTTTNPTPEWDAYMDRCWAQLEWWGTAARHHRAQVDPWDKSPALQTSPSQRNAPKLK